MLDRVSIKSQAKALMRETKPSVYLVSLVYIVIMSILSILSQKLSGAEALITRIQEIANSGGAVTVELLESLVPNVPTFAKLLVTVIEIVTSVVSAGFIFYCVNVYRKRKSGVDDLFCGFNCFLKVFVINLLVGIFVFLWSLLLIFPGMIAAYKYSLAVYVLSEHPDYTPMQCIRESKRLTYGYKMDLFIMNLSFIGWIFVSSIISSLVGALVSYSIPLFNIWLSPYMGITNAGFYAAIRFEKDGVPLFEEKSESDIDPEM